MLALFIIGVLAFVIGLVIWLCNRGNEEYEGEILPIAGKVIVIAGLVMMVAGFALSSFTTIPAGHRGVVLRFGAVTGRIMDEGLHARIPLIESVERMSVQTQKYEVDATSASKDLQDVSTKIALNYHLDPGMATEVYRTLGTEYIDRLAAPAIQEIVKQVTARYIAEDLILKRDEVKAAIMDSLSTRLRERGLITETVSITNFQFSAKFTEAIEAKVAAEQAVLEAENKLRRVKVEAQQREAQALGEANARIAAANGEAEYIRIVTEAQVAANTAIAGSLTPEVLQYILLDRLGQDVKVMVIPSNQGLDLVMPDLAQITK